MRVVIPLVIMEYTVPVVAVVIMVCVHMRKRLVRVLIVVKHLIKVSVIAVRLRPVSIPVVGIWAIRMNWLIRVLILVRPVVGMRVGTKIAVRPRILMAVDMPRTRIRMWVRPDVTMWPRIFVAIDMAGATVRMRIPT